MAATPDGAPTVRRSVDAAAGHHDAGVSRRTGPGAPESPADSSGTRGAAAAGADASVAATAATAATSATDATAPTLRRTAAGRLASTAGEWTAQTLRSADGMAPALGLAMPDLLVTRRASARAGEGGTGTLPSGFGDTAAIRPATNGLGLTGAIGQVARLDQATAVRRMSIARVPAPGYAAPTQAAAASNPAASAPSAPTTSAATRDAVAEPAPASAAAATSRSVATSSAAAASTTSGPSAATASGRSAAPTGRRTASAGGPGAPDAAVPAAGARPGSPASAGQPGPMATGPAALRRTPASPSAGAARHPSIGSSRGSSAAAGLSLPLLTPALRRTPLAASAAPARWLPGQTPTGRAVHGAPARAGADPTAPVASLATAAPGMTRTAETRPASRDIEHHTLAHRVLHHQDRIVAGAVPSPADAPELVGAGVGVSPAVRRMPLSAEATAAVPGLAGFAVRSGLPAMAAAGEPSGSSPERAVVRRLPARPPIALAAPSSAARERQPLLGNHRGGPGDQDRASLLDRTAHLFEDGGEQALGGGTAGLLEAVEQLRQLTATASSPMSPPAPAPTLEGPELEKVVNAVVERIEQRVIDEHVRRGLRDGRGGF